MSAVHLVRPDEGIVGPLRILAGAAQTGGRYFALEWETLPSSPDPRSFHVHEAESESEYVVSGEREISCGDETWRGSAGLFVLVPPRMRHTIRTVNDAPSRWLHFFAPAGLERFFVERERMKAAGSGVAEIAKVAARFGIGDIASRPPERELFVRPSASDEATRRVVVSGEETSGAYALVETSDLRAEQHVHAEQDEAFYVIAGELILELDGDRIVAPARSFVIVPRSTNRRHQLGPASRCLAVFSPGVPGH